MKRLILSSFILFLSFFSNANSPASIYYSKILQAEKAIVNEKLDSAIYLYKSAFEEFDYPFCRNIEQAFLISCFANDYENANFFLEKALLNGLTKLQFEYYIKFWKSLNSEKEINLDYSRIRKLYLANIDTLKMFSYLELDVKRDFLLKKYNKKKHRKTFFQCMNALKFEYIEKISLYGYPTEKTTGSFFNKTIQNKTAVNNIEFSHIYSIDNGSINQKLLLNDENFQMLAMKPGNWFLTHYINSENRTIIDSSFFNILKNGFDSLYLDPLIIVNSLESTQQLNNEFALSYYSQLWAYKLKFDYFKKFDLESSIKQTIDNNRAKYNLRSLRQEEDLLKSLYKLKTKKDLNQMYTSEDLNIIREEIRIFINIF